MSERKEVMTDAKGVVICFEDGKSGHKTRKADGLPKRRETILPWSFQKEGSPVDILTVGQKTHFRILSTITVISEICFKSLSSW